MDQRPQDPIDPPVDRQYNVVDSGPTVRASETEVAYAEDGTRPMPWRDQVRWGPIIAGLLSAITVLLLLTVLGLAIGLSAFEPEEVAGDNVSTSAVIWGAISLLLAFFVGGYVAARSAAVYGGGSAALNGLMVGIAGITLMLALVGLGLGNLLGAIAGNIEDIADISSDLIEGDVSESARAAYDDARDGAWGTLIGLVLALGSAALGGLLGKHEPAPAIRVWERTRRVRETGPAV